MPFIIYDKNAAHADDSQPVIAGQFAEDELYTVLKDAESVPASLIASLQLRDSDVPLYMEKTDLLTKEAALRISDGKSSDLSGTKVDATDVHFFQS